MTSGGVGSLGGAGGRIVLVATPIGNLEDLSARAVRELTDAAHICCEDTRRTRALLHAAGIPSHPARLVSLHEHNEVTRIPRILSWVTDGSNVAVVSDAGTPAVSDPGRRLVAAAIEAGLTVTTVPGPSSVLSALVVSGLPTERFCFEGFLPRKGPERRRRLAALTTEDRTAVIFEAPARVVATMRELAAAAAARGDEERPVVVARELTKVHEEVWRGTVGEAADQLGRQVLRGEVVIVVGGARPLPPPSREDLCREVGTRLDSGDSPRQAADTISGRLGVSRRRVYELAIELREARPRRD